jgi:hypothetical protein
LALSFNGQDGSLLNCERGFDSLWGLQFYIPVAQWIEPQTPKLRTRVRFSPGIPSLLEGVMRILRSLILGAALIAAPVFGQVKPEEKTAIEYNITSCGGRDFTVIHSILSSDRKHLTFGTYLTSPTTVKSDEPPLVLDIEEQPKNDDGVIQFKGTGTFEDAKLEIAGGRLGNRIIGLMYANGKLSHLYYGFVGPIDDIFIGVEDSEKTCSDMRKTDDEQELLEKLVKFLAEGSTRLVPKS